MYSKKYETALIAILFIAWGAVFLDRMALPFLTPFIKPAFSLTDDQIGNLNAVLALGWAASTFLLGALSDRIGRRPVLIPALIAVAGLTVVSGLARSYEELLVVRGLLGIAEGPIWAAMTALISESSSDARRSRNVAIVVSAASIIGLMIAPVLVTQIATHYNWHVAFYVAAVPAFIGAVCIWAFVREPKNDREAHHHHHVPNAQDFRNILLAPNLWLCAIAAAAFMSWLYLLNGFAPLYITEVAHQQPTTAGFVMGASGMGSVVVGFIMVGLSERIGRKMAAMIMAALAVAAPLLIMNHALYEHLWLLAGLQVLTNCGLGISTLLLVIAAAESVPRSMAATAIGLTSMFGEIFGATLMPAFAGEMAARHGLQIPLIMASGSALVMLVVVAMIRFHRQETTAFVPA